ncbi:MAG: ParB/RepB/Spo0J family partition protein [Rubrivivax sp.]|nr:ParB/RepB/Spo0J family partition protein [Rubrivivax sp.]
MSIKNKLLDLTSDLGGASAPSPAVTFPKVIPAAGARTAPGQMLEFRTALQERDKQLEALRAELAQHDGALPARQLDPKRIAPSTWANRAEASFKTPAFEALKADLAASGGNVQPIRVRPAVRNDADWEIIFGHRRHRACLELGLPVLALIDLAPVDDQSLFALMDRENRQRADLSVWEQGVAYRQALDAGLFPSRRKLADALGVSHTWVNNALLVAELPPAVVECFTSPLQIQHRHARELTAALEADSKAVIRRAEKLRKNGPPSSAAAVVSALVATAPGPSAPEVKTLKANGIELGRWQKRADGSCVLELASGVVTPERVPEILENLAVLLRSAAESE